MNITVAVTNVDICSLRLGQPKLEGVLDMVHVPVRLESTPAYKLPHRF